MGYPDDKITTEERKAILDNFGGYIRSNLIVDAGHRALPNSRAQYILGSLESVGRIDSRMTGWGYDDDLAIECLYNNIKTMMWNTVKVVEE